MSFVDKTKELYFSTDNLDHALYYVNGTGTNINGKVLSNPLVSAYINGY